MKTEKIFISIPKFLIKFIPKKIILDERENMCEKESNPYSANSKIPSIGSDFKKYILENNMPEKIKALKNNLDSTSIQHIDYMLDAIMNFPSSSAKSNFFANKPVRNYYPDWLLPEIEKAEKETNKLYEQGFWGGQECNYYKHGITLLPEKVQEYIKNKSFFDLGAWDGDSVTALAECSPSKILSFEISQKNIDKYLEKTKSIKVPNEIFRMALSNKSGTMNFDDLGTWGDTLAFGGAETVEVDTLDNFSKNKDLKVGFIKADIESDEINMLKGSVETIKKDKPVISVSIYHDPISFFEIKPFLESLDINYKYIIRVMGFYDVGPINEASLIAYPLGIEI